MQESSGGMLTVMYSVEPLSTTWVMVPGKQFLALERIGSEEMSMSSGRMEAW